MMKKSQVPQDLYSVLRVVLPEKAQFKRSQLTSDLVIENGFRLGVNWTVENGFRYRISRLTKEIQDERRFIKQA
jgi:hypothetical protein